MQTTHDAHLNQADQVEPSSFGARLLAMLGAVSNHVALLTAWIAMSGSLFFSEVLGWPPCVLCWYQRILMYPLTLILAVGILRRDQSMYLYVLPFSLLGALTSLYHYLLTKTTWFPPPPCTVGVSCTVDYLNWFGFINIPFLALTAFLIITLMMILSILATSDDAAFAEELDDAAPASVPALARGLDISAMAVGVIIVGVVSSFVLLARII